MKAPVGSAFGRSIWLTIAGVTAAGRQEPPAVLKRTQAAASGPSPPSFPVSNRVLPDAEKGREFRLGQAEPLPSLQDPLWEVLSYRERKVAKELGDPPEVLRAGLGLAQLPVQDGPGVDSEQLSNRPLRESQVHPAPS